MASGDVKPPRLGLAQALDLSATLWLGLAGVALLAYGYEIFNFNLTIDEELHAAGGVGRRDWIAQGRWGMALVGTVLLRNPVGPVVSTFLGVAGTIIGLVLALRWTFRLDARATAVVTALAVTTPTLAFIFTFSTIAFGVGVAFVATALSVRYASFYTLRGAAAACAFGALAIAIYQPFVVAIAMLAAANAIREVQARSSVARRHAYWVACVAGSFVLYALVSAAAVKLQPIDVEYMGKYLDLAGLWANLAGRLRASCAQVSDVLILHPEMFGASSPWLAPTLAAAAALAIVVPLVRRAHARLLANAAVLCVTVAIVVLAGAISGDVPPLRSMVYLPIAIAVVAAVGCGEAASRIRAVFWTLCLLAVVGNATIANHLFASAADAEWQDRLVAREVAKYVRSVDPALISDRKPIKIEPVGVVSWPETALRHVRGTFGASFFEWDGGNRIRIAAYLRLAGVNATWEDTAAERARAYEVARTMPAWPHEGWVRFAAPDLLVIKFGDYTPNQAADLCTWGVKALCVHSAPQAR